MGNCFDVPSAPDTPRPSHAAATTADATTNISNGSISVGAAPPVGGVLGIPLSDIYSDYEFGPELGRGQFGITRHVTNRATGEQLACKSIPRRRLILPADVTSVRREVDIMRHLAGHRNVVELRAVYEDSRAVHLVMELCEGGELFERIIERGHYSERDAARIFRDVAAVVDVCHSKGVFHRDLKPENFLFLIKHEDSPLKATDFGLSAFFKPGQVFSEVVGSVYYVAPEVLQRCYGPESDIWSAGVILYILLSGFPPFWAENDRGIFQAILYKRIDFSCDPWPSISSGAKDLVEKMLCRDPKGRPSAAEVLSHPWIVSSAEGRDTSDTAIGNIVVMRMKRFRAMNKLKKVAMKVIAENLSDEEIRGLKEVFESMDADNNGLITFDELKTGLMSLGSKLSESEAKKLMEAADVDGNGIIDYTEFIMATMNRNKLERDDLLHKAFEYFDKDRSGYITMDDLEQTLARYNIGDLETTKDIVAEVDNDHDGRINYDEFVAMMKTGNPETLPLREQHA